MTFNIVALIGNTFTYFMKQRSYCFSFCMVIGTLHSRLQVIFLQKVIFDFLLAFLVGRSNK